MKTNKRILAFLLALSMLLGMGAVTSFASDDAEKDEILAVTTPLFDYYRIMHSSASASVFVPADGSTSAFHGAVWNVYNGDSGINSLYFRTIDSDVDSFLGPDGELPTTTRELYQADPEAFAEKVASLIAELDDVAENYTIYSGDEWRALIAESKTLDQNAVYAKRSDVEKIHSFLSSVLEEEFLPGKTREDMNNEYYSNVYGKYMNGFTYELYGIVYLIGGYDAAYEEIQRIAQEYIGKSGAALQAFMDEYNDEYRAINLLQHEVSSLIYYLQQKIKADDLLDGKVFADFQSALEAIRIDHTNDLFYVNDEIRTAYRNGTLQGVLDGIRGEIEDVSMEYIGESAQDIQDLFDAMDDFEAKLLIVEVINVAASKGELQPGKTEEDLSAALENAYLDAKFSTETLHDLILMKKAGTLEAEYTAVRGVYDALAEEYLNAYALKVYYNACDYLELMIITEMPGDSDFEYYPMINEGQYSEEIWAAYRAEFARIDSALNSLTDEMELYDQVGRAYTELLQAQELILGDIMPADAKAAMDVILSKAETFAVFVLGGTGSGSYANGAQVPIVANAPAEDKAFDKWTTSGGGTFADATVASTTFTTPGVAVLLTATHKNTYALTVIGGTGSGTYAEGEKIALVADAPPADKVFDKWTTSGGGSFAGDTSANTMFTMPGAAVTVTATYKDAPVPPSKTALNAKITEVKNTAKGNYTDATWNAFQTALTAAQSVANKADATQTEIENALTALTNAFSGLKENPADNTKYIKLWGKTTKYVSNFWNWLMCILLFGWIWMAF